MRRATITTIAAILFALAAIVYLSMGCSTHWATYPRGELTLEQRGVLVKVAARRAVIETYRRGPGEWKDHICSVATIVLEALDGRGPILDCGLGTADYGSADFGLLTSDFKPEKEITIETKAMLLGLLRYTAENRSLDGWEAAMMDAMELFDAFVVLGVTSEHEVWFLTREFFAGIVEGCALEGSRRKYEG